VGSTGDDPSVAEVHVHDDVRDNDIIMVYSDGYGDNVFTDKFPDCISKYLNKETKHLDNVSRVADC